jgi:hypothetical protein
VAYFKEGKQWQTRIEKNGMDAASRVAKRMRNRVAASKAVASKAVVAKKAASVVVRKVVVADALVVEIDKIKR